VQEEYKKYVPVSTMMFPEAMFVFGVCLFRHGLAFASEDAMPSHHAPIDTRNAKKDGGGEIRDSPGKGNHFGADGGAAGGAAGIGGWPSLASSALMAVISSSASVWMASSSAPSV